MSDFGKHFRIGWQIAIMFGALVSLFVFYQHGWNIERAILEIIVICLICIISHLFPDIDTKSFSQKAI